MSENSQPVEKKAGGRVASDWERIETAYRAGVLSVREIASENGLSHTAIHKRAKAQGWDRDLGAKIKSKADALVSRLEVASQVSTKTALSERQLIEAGAEAIARVRLAHRKDINAGRSIVMSLLGELRIQSADPALFEELGELMRSPDDKGMDKLNEAYRKVIGFGGRVDNVKKLSEALKNLIALEREAYGLTVEQQINLKTSNESKGTMTPSEAYKVALNK
jgi:hypothetical protein